MGIRLSEWVRSWRLLSWRSTVVAAALAYVVAGFLVVPPVAKSLITNSIRDTFGREATVENIRCNPFTLSLTVEGFSLPDRPGLTLLSFDELYLNLQASSLFRWAITLKELRIERPLAAVRRFEDQAINILELMEHVDSSVPQDQGSRLPRALFQVIRVADGRLQLEDHARAEPLRWEWAPVEATLHNISTLPEKQGDNDFVIGLPDGGSLRLAGTVVLEPLGLDGKVAVEKVSIQNMWPAVEDQFEFDLTGGTFASQFNYRVTLQDDGLNLTVIDAQAHMVDLSMRTTDAETDLLRADSIEVSGARFEWPEQRVEVDAVMVDGAYGFVWIAADGTPSWDVLIPKPTQEEIVEAYRYVEERVSFDAALGRLEVRNASAAFEDRTFDQPVRFEVHDGEAVVTDISSEPGTAWGFDGAAALAGEARASARGTVGVLPLQLEAEVEAENLDLSRLQPYVAKLAPLDLRSGTLQTSGTTHVTVGEEAPEVFFEGELGISGLDLHETVTDGLLLEWGDLEVAGIRAALTPMSLDVAEVDIHKAGLEITIAADGTINLLELLKGMTGGEAPTSTTVPSGGLPSIRVARLRLDECYGTYTDQTTMGEPFSSTLEAINGTISGATTETPAGAGLEIEARIDSGGLIRLEGEIDPLDYSRLTDLGIDCRDISLPALSPMSVKYIGHPMETGAASLDLDYDIDDQKLVASNHLEVDDLVLGDKVDGQGVVALPFKLGVSLLKDKEGRITLDIPLEGTLGVGGFGIGTAVGAAAKEIVSELAKSPFRLLAKLGGSDDADLEFVEFAAGGSALANHAIENLKVLTKALDQRPGLALHIEGGYDQESDLQALREAALEASLTSRLPTAGGEAAQVVPLDVLENLFIDRLSGEELDTLRSAHTATAQSNENAPTEPAINETTYREALRGELVASQPIDETAAHALAVARAQAIWSYLIDQSGVDAGRVSIASEPAIQSSGERWVRCRLEVKPR